MQEILQESLAQVLSCEFCEISKNTFFTEYLGATVSVYISYIIHLFTLGTAFFQQHWYYFCKIANFFIQLLYFCTCNFNLLSANLTKSSNTLKQFVGCCWRIVWVFDNSVGLALKGLINLISSASKQMQTYLLTRNNCFVNILKESFQVLRMFR